MLFTKSWIRFVTSVWYDGGSISHNSFGSSSSKSLIGIKTTLSAPPGSWALGASCLFDLGFVVLLGATRQYHRPHSECAQEDIFYYMNIPFHWSTEINSGSSNCTAERKAEGVPIMIDCKGIQKAFWAYCLHGRRCAWPSLPPPSSAPGLASSSAAAPCCQAA